jgi:ABC-type spermidine/putrescine transport system permease subunit II
MATMLGCTTVSVMALSAPNVGIIVFSLNAGAMMSQWSGSLRQTTPFHDAKR